MAKVASVNIDCAANGGAEAIWNLINLLVNGGGGWSIVAQSDASGGNITHAGTGAGGLNNPNAYVVIQEPAGGQGRRYFFQRSSGANDYAWWIRYMRSNVVLGGGDSITMPFPTPNTTGTIENLIGTGAAGATLFDTAGGAGTRNYYTHAVAMTTASNNGFFFAVFTTIKTTGTMGGGMIALPLLAPPQNLDSLLLLIGTTTGPFNTGQLFNTKVGYFKYGLVGQDWKVNNIVSVSLSNLNIVNPYSGEDDVFSPRWQDQAAGSYMGGTSLVLQAGLARGYPNTINLNTDAFVYTHPSAGQGLLLPWPNGVTPLL
jgi:hypothetical protein